MMIHQNLKLRNDFKYAALLPGECKVTAAYSLAGIAGLQS